MIDASLKRVLDNPVTCRMMFNELKRRGVRFQLSYQGSAFIDAEAAWLEHDEMRDAIIHVMREIAQREADE